MTSPRFSGPLSKTFNSGMLLLLLAMAFLAPGPAAAQVCDRLGCNVVRQGTSVVCFTPAKVQSSSLWGSLQPVGFNAASGALPSERDATSFNEFTQGYDSRNWYFSVDVENGWVLAGLAHGIAIWDGRTNPGDPTFTVAKRYSAAAGFPFIPPGEQSKIVFQSIDAPDDTVAALAGDNGAGLLVFNLADKTQPKPVYQNIDKTSKSVYATTINGTKYAFLASSSPGKVFIYDLTKALTYNGCMEDAVIQCPGVLVGSISTPGTPYFVHGVGNYLAVGMGSSKGFQIYDISNPLNPQLEITALQGATGRPVQGVAMWNQGSTYYLAARLGRTALSNLAQVGIYNVSCITGTCTGLGSPVSLRNYDTLSGEEYLTFSRASGGVPFLYVGGDGKCNADQGAIVQQREWLLNVSDPSNPTDVTPTATISASALYGGIQTSRIVNYWTWSYHDGPTGFNLVAPRAGKFNGDYFFRAARSIFDFHKLTLNTPPVSNFTWNPPTEIYPGTLVSFTDTSSGAPNQWQWTFQDASPLTDFVPNPQRSFTSSGPKTVTLTASSNLGTGTTASKNVIVLDPNPSGTLAADTLTATQCQAVTFTANATGAPPLTYNWEVRDPSNMIADGPVDGGSTFVWTSEPGDIPGVYTGKVTVKNSFNPTGVALTKTVVLTPLPTLTNIVGLLPSADFTTNFVQFQAPTHLGATKWVWDYGDGVTETFTNATQGKSPTHTYAQVGSFQAKVTISNCTNLVGFTSAPVTVNVTQLTQLTAAFTGSLFCQFGQCFATAGAPVTFIDQSTGAERYDYDWTHSSDNVATCNFTDNNHTSPVTSHTFATVGDVYPCLRVRRGASEHKEFVHGKISVAAGTGGGTASVSVSCSPTSVNVNSPTSCSASASNCSPSSNGWSWSTGGGTASGGSSSAISVQWTSPGAKTVSATNSACGSASGSRTITVSDPNSPAISISGPSSGNVNSALSFTATAANCTASASWTWTASAGGTVTGAGNSVTVSWPTSGGKTVSVTNTGCSGVTGSKGVTITDPGSGGAFTAQFNFSPAAPKVGEAVAFDAGSSTGVPSGSSYSWGFGDNTTGSGLTVSHTYSSANSYSVQLTIVPPGCLNTACLVNTSKTVVVSNTPSQQTSAEYTTSAPCTSVGGFTTCDAQTGVPVTFTADVTDATTYSWDFGDQTTGSGRTVTHTWNDPASRAVTLNVTKGAANATKSKTFNVTGTPVASFKGVLLPWIAQTRGALEQLSDLYLHNPGTTAMDVTLEFRKKGLPETNPPRVKRTIQPGATLYVPDALRGLFNRENVAGFITVSVDKGEMEPVVTSFNTTFENGKQFGQTVPGTSMSRTGSASATAGPEATAAPQYLVGLNDNSERLAYFGLSNPSDQGSTYRLRFFDNTGRLIHESGDLGLSRFGQTQYQVKQIRETFGVTDEDDYRIEVKTMSGSPVFPYGSNLRLSSNDPSFVSPGSFGLSKMYLIGSLSVPGLNNSVWQTDLVLSNVSDQLIQTDVTFTSVGINSTPTQAVKITLQPGQTQRLEDVVGRQWGLRNGIGVLTLTSTSPSGIFPIAVGESYDNAVPAKRYGQSMAAVSESSAATKKELLVGLRQNSTYRTTFWLHNPSNVTGEYDVVYRGLDGAVLGTTAGVRLGAGKSRQFSPGQHPIPTAGVPNGFTVEIVVKAGKALAAAQVINNATNDPAYIQGEAR